MPWFNRRRPASRSALGEDRPEEPMWVEPIWYELGTRRFWFLVVLGVVALSTSTNIDQHIVIKFASLPLDERMKRLAAPWYQNPEIWAGTLRDIGFASLIALTLGVFVDRASRIRQQRAVERALQAVTTNVLQASFKLKTPQSIVNLALSSIFSVPVIRKSHRLTFVLSDLDDIANNPEGKYLKLAISSDYELENVSGAAVDHLVRLNIPLPPDPALRTLAKVISGTVGDEPLDAALIARGDNAIADTDYERRYIWTKHIVAGETLRVVTNYELVKEKSDNEIWTSFLPTQTLDVIADVQLDLEWNIDSRHSGNLRSLDGPQDGPRHRGRVTFRTQEPILPFQGVTFWWRPPGQHIHQDGATPARVVG
ncbi:MAG TPA: hypothetical protein VMV13_00430 [Candidatus Binataceae bacterium]|nr:hypothetical protein [Candidatus Binataceae bacterium]